MLKEDIFDKIMKLPVLRILEPVYKKYKEILLYLFFGGLAFVISVASYTIAIEIFRINELIANIISWVLAVVFAFFTNRTWVFDGQVEGAKTFFVQMGNFFCGRIVTLLVEEVILFVFVTYLQYNSVLIKIIAQIVVIVLNYIISKLWIFRNNKVN